MSKIVQIESDHVRLDLSITEVNLLIHTIHEMYYGKANMNAHLIDELYGSLVHATQELNKPYEQPDLSEIDF